MNFKVGDSVTIADLNNMKDEPHFGINSSMVKYSGRRATILKIRPGSYTPQKPDEDGCLYRIDLDNSEWSWSNLMFSKSSPFKVSDEDFE